MQIRFLGAAGNVTGSSTLVETEGRRLLVDCGLFQERRLLERNWAPLPFEAAKIDAVLLTHAHLDHCGLLPKLVREGFRGPIYCTSATAEIARIVLADSARLQEEDASHKRRRHAREGRKGPHPETALYTAEDAEAVAPLFRSAHYGSPVDLGEGVTATFFSAGHILGAASILVEAADGRGSARPLRLLFSGDVGRWDRPLVEDPQPPAGADYVVLECTYGDREHEAVDVATSLAAVVEETWKRGGNLVVPSFAVERAQDLLYYFNLLLDEDRIPHLFVFLDSPMAVKVVEVFERHRELLDQETRNLLRRGKSPFQFPGLRFVGTTEESKALNHLRGTVVVIAGSGMCTGGRIKHHLAANIGRPESTILFVGYQAEGTLGREILDGAQEVRIHGETHPVRATVRSIDGFSGHADSRELLRWLGELSAPPRAVLLNHGEPQALEAMRSLVGEQLGWRASVAEAGKSVSLA